MPEKSLKARLDEYYTLLHELPLLDEDILKEKNKTAIAGSYQYSSGSGVRERILTMSVGSLRTYRSLIDRKEKIQAELESLEAIVFNIHDSEMRQILTVAYFNGGRLKRWERVADHFGEIKSGKSYEVKAKRYLDKLERANVFQMF